MDYLETGDTDTATSLNNTTSVSATATSASATVTSASASPSSSKANELFVPRTRSTYQTSPPSNEQKEEMVIIPRIIAPERDFEHHEHEENEEIDFDLTFLKPKTEHILWIKEKFLQLKSKALQWWHTTKYCLTCQCCKKCCEKKKPEEKLREEAYQKSVFKKKKKKHSHGPDSEKKHHHHHHHETHHHTHKKSLIADNLWDVIEQKHVEADPDAPKHLLFIDEEPEAEVKEKRKSRKSLLKVKGVKRKSVVSTSNKVKPK